jgi:hypothetical protein
MKQLWFLILCMVLTGQSQAQPVMLATNRSYLLNIMVDENRVYWTQQGNGGAASVDKWSGGPVTEYGGTHAAFQIVQDANSIYFHGYKTGDPTAHIYQADKGVAGSAVALHDSVRGYWLGLTIAPKSAALFWASNEFVFKAPLNGGVVAPLPGIDNSPETDALSTDGERLYFSTPRSIKHIPLTGGAPVTDVEWNEDRRVFSLVTPSAGKAAGSIFWLESRPNFSNPNTLKRRAPDGRILTLLTNVIPSLNSFTVDDDEIFASAESVLVHLSIEGGPPSLLWRDDSRGSVASVAVDAENIYWTATLASPSSDTVFRLPRPVKSRPYLEKIESQGNGVSLRTSSLPGLPFRIERSLNLTNWSTWTNFPGGSVFEAIDFDRALNRATFYRLVSP